MTVNNPLPSADLRRPGAEPVERTPPAPVEDRDRPALDQPRRAQRRAQLARLDRLFTAAMDAWDQSHHPQVTTRTRRGRADGEPETTTTVKDARGQARYLMVAHTVVAEIGKLLHLERPDPPEITPGLPDASWTDEQLAERLKALLVALHYDVSSVVRIDRSRAGATADTSGPLAGAVPPDEEPEPAARAALSPPTTDADEAARPADDSPAPASPIDR